MVADADPLKSALTALIASESFERVLLQRERPVVGHAGAGQDYFISALATALEAPVLAVAPGPREAEALAAGIAAFLGPDAVALLPAWEALPYESISPAPDIAARRAGAVARARSAQGAFVLVAPVSAMMQKLVPTLGQADPVRLSAGRVLAPDALADRLDALGYSRADVVEHRGEFAVRGGVVDIFPGTARRPVRLEYWGDEIESIKEFVPSTQLSSARVAEVVVLQVREMIVGPEEMERAQQLASTTTGRFGEGLQKVADGEHFEGMETLAPLVFDRMERAADLIEPSWAVITQADRALERARQIYDEADALASAVEWKTDEVMMPLTDALDGHVEMRLSSFTQGIDLGLASWGTAQANSPEMVGRLSALTEKGYKLVLTARSPGSLERVREVTAETMAALPDGTVSVLESPLGEGFISDAMKLAVATEEDLFGTRRHSRTAPRFTARGTTGSIADELEIGDYAVHRIHGVARYLGIQHREIGGSERDYLVLEYSNGDKLFVPSDQVGMVARYLGGEAPRVHRLGGSDWAKATGKVRKAVKDMAGELVRLYAARMAAPGHAFGPDTPWQFELEDAFPHQETGDQLTAIEEVKADMMSPRPMDRLICGDVGFGKTEIALRAAFKAVMEGKQVAVLVPTTILAEQHFITFKERFAPFPVKVAMLSRFVSKADQKQTLEALAKGEVDVIVGTHRLIGSDIKFKDLGLLVVDEEHRFGVSHKEKLKRLRANLDVLTMTATPIPRTLEMALSGIREMSTIDTPPEDRQPVLTYVGAFDEALAIGAIRRELLREGQVFWVHNRVATIDRQAARIQSAVPEARIAIAHGQMDETQLEQQMMKFWEREADILVCSTIIESGLDVPNANTMIIDQAERLGLAQLYQLRGRVGRSAERAFAYFFFSPQREMTEDAHERLETIAKHQALGSGFRIALRDLEIRGAGNILGGEQSGHIASVGFDTYARLLAEQVQEMKGEPMAIEKDLRIDLPVKAFVPPGWIAQEALRLELYRRISTAGDHEILAAIRDETIDRYGALPDAVETLFAIASLRVTCIRLGVEEVTTFKDQVRIAPLEMSEGLLVDLAERVYNASYHVEKKTLNLVPERVFGAELVRWVEMWLREAVGEDRKPGLPPLSQAGSR